MSDKIQSATEIVQGHVKDIGSANDAINEAVAVTYASDVILAPDTSMRETLQAVATAISLFHKVLGSDKEKITEIASEFELADSQNGTSQP